MSSNPSWIYYSDQGFERWSAVRGQFAQQYRTMSTNDSDVKPPAVLVVDDQFRADLFEIWLRESYPVRTASSHVQALTQLDSTVAVVVLRHDLSADVKSDVESRMQAVSPTAQLAVITADEGDVVFPDVEFDAIIREPITKAKLEENVRKLVRRARYHEALKKYYQHTLQSTNMEVEGSREGKSSNDDARTVQEQITGYKRLIGELEGKLDRSDKEAVLDSLRPTPALPESTDGEQKTLGKYVPDSCGNCGLDWGVDHGGDLGKGYESVAAFTWRCTDCGTVRDVPTPNGRQVARRRY